MNQTQAINIVNNLKGLIYNHIFIYDDKGRVLASNKACVNPKYLEYGEIVARSNKILVMDEEEFNHKCIVIPVNVDGGLVGIVGLSGDFENVSQYGEMIVKVTELLLRESVYYEHKMKSRENNRFLINKLLLEGVDYKSVVSNAKLLGYEVNNFKFLVIVDVFTMTEREIIQENIINSIENFWVNNELVGTYEENIIILISESDTRIIKDKMKELKRYLEKKHFTQIKIGISNKIEHLEDIRMAYHQASKLLKLSTIKGIDNVYNFEDYALELVFLDISPKIGNSFVKNIFGDLSLQEIDDISRILEVYINNNGSINKTSTELYVHKNTLQYKLNKIKDKTGYNPRKLKELFEIYTALNFYYLNK